MLGYQLVLGNVDQQVALQKDLDNARQHGGDDLHGSRSGVARADEDARMEVLAVDGMCEGAHVLDSNVTFSVEFHPEGADGSRLVGGWSVLLDHVGAGVGFEGEAFAAVREVSVCSVRLLGAGKATLDGHRHRSIGGGTLQGLS